MGTRVIMLLAVFGALAAAAAGARVVLTPSVFHAAVLPSDTITSFRVTCPRGHAAVSGGIFRPAPGTTPVGIRPAGSRAYSFRVANPSKNARQRVTAVASCRKIRAPGKAPLLLKLRLRRTKPVGVTPTGTSSASLSCPRGMAAAGFGHDFDPVRLHGLAPGAAANLSVRRETASPHSFLFAVRNSGRTGRSVVFYGNCVTVVRRAGDPRVRLHVKLTTFTVSVPPGTRMLARRCPRGWFSLAAGFALRSPLTSLDGAAAVGGGGRWSLRSDAQGPTAADIQLSCGRLSSG
jgi:hypothetical protein